MFIKDKIFFNYSGTIRTELFLGKFLSDFIKQT